METLAKRILIGPEMFGHSLADNDHFFSAGAVSIGEFSAAQQWNVQRPEIIGSDVVELGQRAAITGSFILPFGEHRALKPAAQREIGGYRRVFDSRRILGAIDHRT